MMRRDRCVERRGNRESFIATTQTTTSRKADQHMHMFSRMRTNELGAVPHSVMNTHHPGMQVKLILNNHWDHWDQKKRMTLKVDKRRNKATDTRKCPECMTQEALHRTMPMPTHITTRHNI